MCFKLPTRTKFHEEKIVKPLVRIKGAYQSQRINFISLNFKSYVKGVQKGLLSYRQNKAWQTL